MKRKKSMLSIVGVLVLSLSFVGGASATPPVCSNEVTILCGYTPKPPKCQNGYCPIPVSIIPEV